jgi:hypothetical protein
MKESNSIGEKGILESNSRRIQAEYKRAKRKNRPHIICTKGRDVINTRCVEGMKCHAFHA